MTPIRPENRDRYPANWAEIRRAILERAGHVCEWCGKPNGERVWVTASGRWALAKPGLSPLKCKWLDHTGHPTTKPLCWNGTRVVLTIAHLDHQPEHNDPDNLRALCQRCHLRWDADHHRATRRRTKLEAERDPRQQEMF